MKNKNILVLLLVLLVTATSCKKSFLNLTPASKLTEGTYYQNTAQVEGGVIACYDGLQQTMQFEYQLTSLRSDEMAPYNFEGDWGGINGFYEKSSNSFLINFWSASYNTIARANLVLKYIDNVTDAGKKAIFQGEAKFIRAHMFFNLVRLWGDVPLITERIAYNDEPKFKRVAAADVYTQIISDLQDAIANCPTIWPSASKGRITKYAAEAMLANVYLTQKNYAAAKPLVDDIIASNAYQLLPNYADIFSLDNEMNKEILYSIGYAAATNGEGERFTFNYSPRGATTGFKPEQELLNLFAPNDQRLAVSVFYNNGLPYCTTKFQDPTAPAGDAGNDIIVIRYSEVLLMKAEINANLNTDAMADPANMSDQDSLDILSPFNRVRIRAGVVPYSKSSFTDLSSFMDKLLNERLIEFCFENKRWYDLLRTKTASDLVSLMDAHFILNGHSNLSMKPTQTLMAIPQSDINLSDGNLTQNPGY